MTLARTWALIIGWVFTIVGIIGFFTGPTLLFFQLGILHSAVYLITGLIALFIGYYMVGRYSRTFDQVLGIVYAVLTVVGFAVAGVGSAVLLGILPLNLADNILHLVVAVVSLAAGYLTRKEVMMGEETMRKAA